MAVADFPLKLGLVLRTLNLSRGRLAQLIGIDKSAVSRWASGVQEPSDHNLSLLTDAVARYRAGFSRNDWDLGPNTLEVRLTGTGANQAPERPSIVVLPFQNMNDDPDQDYLGDGMVDDIIAALSRSRDFLVIARNSSLSYKGMSPDVRQVGRELGVRYVLEGSVRKAGDRLRITAQLIDAVTGAHIWVERYDRESVDIFSLQDEIAESVVASIEPQLLLAEGNQSKRKPPANLDAWGYVVRAFAHRTATSRTQAEMALAQLERALECDPDYARAFAELAILQALMAYQGWVEDRDQGLQAATVAARRAVALDPTDPWSHMAMGIAPIFARRYSEGIASLSKAIELNPNFALAHSRLGSALAYVGRAEEGIQHTARALRISPRDPQKAYFLQDHAIALFGAAKYREAAEYAERAHQERPELPQALRLMTAARALSGDLAQAKEHLEKLKRLVPDATIASIDRNSDASGEVRARIIEGLRLAGLR
jgi:adenylate cyclase